VVNTEIFGKIDKQLVNAIEKETEKLAAVQATGEEIPGIVVGGDIMRATRSSESPANGGRAKKRARTAPTE
jgi:hypothetical protein